MNAGFNNNSIKNTIEHFKQPTFNSTQTYGTTSVKIQFKTFYQTKYSCRSSILNLKIKALYTIINP